MKEDASVTNEPVYGMTAIRSGLVALAFAVAIFSPGRVLYAQPAQGNEMNHHDSGWMSGGGMWVWTVIGVLVVVLLAVVIAKRSKE